MPKAPLFLLVAVAGLLPAAGASAAANLRWSVDLSKPVQCQTTVRAGADNQLDHLIVSLSSKESTIKAPETLTVVDKDDKPVLTIARGASIGEVDAEGLAGQTLKLKDSKSVLCEQQLPLSPVPPPVPEPTAKSDPFSDLDARALAFLQRDGIREHTRTGKRVVLYHLPDGSLAFPAPAHLTEQNEIDLRVVVPSDAAVKFEVTSCDEVPSFRILGSYKEAAEVVGVLKEAITWTVRSYGSILQCAKSLGYKISVARGGETVTRVNSLTMDPVYRLSFNAGMVFDFGRRQSLSLKDRATADGTSTEKFVSSVSERAGVRPMVSLGAHFCGANPKDWNVCDWFEPFVGVDPAKLTDGFLFGLELSPFYGFGFVAGGSVFKVDVLDPSAGVSPGEPFKATGDLPVHRAYGSGSLGWFAGVAVTPDVLAGLRGK